MQRKFPMAAMSAYLNGFHFYADDMGRQVEASHLCIHLHQCLIFDRNASDARLIGIEYMISAARYRALPDDEKRLWHKHHYEMRSGTLTAPSIPDLAERAYFEDLVTTNGKTFRTWQNWDDFPYGVSQLMMGFTADGELDFALLRPATGGSECRMKRCGGNRAGIPMPAVEAGANGIGEWA